MIFLAVLILAVLFFLVVVAPILVGIGSYKATKSALYVLTETEKQMKEAQK